MNIINPIQQIIKVGSSLFLFFMIIGAWSPPLAFALLKPVIDTKETDEVYIIRSELQRIKVYGLSRISIADPTIVDIEDASDTEITVIGLSPGYTVMFIWDDLGKRIITIHVSDSELKLIKERIETLLKAVEIYNVTAKINDKEGKIILSGEITEEKRDVYDQIIVPFGRDILDMVIDEKYKDLIQIDLQITELTTTLSKALGIDWSGGTEGGINLTYAETLPANLDGNIADFFRVGDFRRTNALTAAVDALLAEGKGRILSKPSVVVVNGEEASFLVGGEIPIRTTTTTEGSVQENVTFKDYGISMGITPIIDKTVGKEKINLELDVEVSDIDAALSVGSDVAFLIRSASTNLFLDDGQTIVLAGLIKHNESESIKKVPFLGNIPLIGLMFTHKSNPSATTDTELVISMTPTILMRNRKYLTRAQKEEPSVPSLAQEKMVVTEKDFSPEQGESKIVVPEKENKQEFEEKTVAAKLIEGGEAVLPSIPENMEEYILSVQQKISQSIIYPKEAQEFGWEGIVKVEMLILHNGELAFSLIKESSGYEVFDKEALRITKKSASYGKFPANVSVKEISIIVPIVFNLKEN